MSTPPRRPSNPNQHQQVSSQYLGSPTNTTAINVTATNTTSGTLAREDSSMRHHQNHFGVAAVPPSLSSPSPTATTNNHNNHLHIPSGHGRGAGTFGSFYEQIPRTSSMSLPNNNNNNKNNNTSSSPSPNHQHQHQTTSQQPPQQQLVIHNPLDLRLLSIFDEELTFRSYLLLQESSAMAKVWQMKCDLTATSAYTSAHFRQQKAMSSMKSMIDLSREAAKEEGARKMSMLLQQEVSKRQALEVVVDELERKLHLHQTKELTVTTDLRVKIDELERKLRADRQMHSTGVQEVKLSANRALAERSIAQNEAAEAARCVVEVKNEMKKALAENKAEFDRHFGLHCDRLMKLEEFARSSMEELQREEIERVLFENCFVYIRQHEQDCQEKMKKDRDTIFSVIDKGLNKSLEMLSLSSSSTTSSCTTKSLLQYFSASSSLSNDHQQEQEQNQQQEQEQLLASWLDKHVQKPILQKLKRDETEIENLRSAVIQLAERSVDQERLLANIQDVSSNSLSSLAKRASTAENQVQYAKSFIDRRDKNRQRLLHDSLENLYKEAESRLPDHIYQRRIVSEEEIERSRILLQEQNEFTQSIVFDFKQKVEEICIVAVNAFHQEHDEHERTILAETEKKHHALEHNSVSTQVAGADEIVRTFVLEDNRRKQFELLKRRRESAGMAIFDPIEAETKEVSSSFSPAIGINVDDVDESAFSDQNIDHPQQRGSNLMIMTTNPREEQQNQHNNSSAPLFSMSLLPPPASTNTSSNNNQQLSSPTSDQAGASSSTTTTNQYNLSCLTTTTTAYDETNKNNNKAQQKNTTTTNNNNNNDIAIVIEKPDDENSGNSEYSGHHNLPHIHVDEIDVIDDDDEDNASTIDDDDNDSCDYEKTHQRKNKIQKTSSSTRQHQHQKQVIESLREAVHVATTRADVAERKLTVVIQSQLRRARQALDEEREKRRRRRRQTRNKNTTNTTSNSQYYDVNQRNNVDSTDGDEDDDDDEENLSGSQSDDSSSSEFETYKSQIKLYTAQLDDLKEKQQQEKEQESDSKNNTNKHQKHQDQGEDEREIIAKEFEKKIVKLQKEKVDLQRKLEQALAQSAMAEERRCAAVDRKLKMYGEMDVMVRRVGEAEQYAIEMETALRRANRHNSNTSGAKSNSNSNSSGRLTPTIAPNNNNSATMMFNNNSNSLTPGFSQTSFDSVGVLGPMGNYSFPNTTNSGQSFGTIMTVESQQSIIQHHHQHLRNNMITNQHQFGASATSIGSLNNNNNNMITGGGGGGIGNLVDSGGLSITTSEEYHNNENNNISEVAEIDSVHLGNNQLGRSPSITLGSRDGGANNSLMNRSQTNTGRPSVNNSSCSQNNQSRNNNTTNNQNNSTGGSLMKFGSVAGSVPFTLRTAANKNQSLLVKVAGAGALTRKKKGNIGGSMRMPSFRHMNSNNNNNPNYLQENNNTNNLSTSGRASSMSPQQMSSGRRTPGGGGGGNNNDELNTNTSASTTPRTLGQGQRLNSGYFHHTNTNTNNNNNSASTTTPPNQFGEAPVRQSRLTGKKDLVGIGFQKM